MTNDETLDLLLAREALERGGYCVGLRDPKRNTDYEGTFMVCDREDLDRPASKDAEDCYYCVVGDSLDDLIQEAYYELEFDSEAA